jgi:hypothetical protein
MSVIEVDYDEVVAFNEAIFDLHAACDWAREIRDAYELGELDLSDEEQRELVEMIRDKVETCERWQTVLRLHPMRLPVAAEGKPEQSASRVPVLPRNCSFGPGPTASFGNFSLGPGNYALRNDD